MKVLINHCYGGFGTSELARKMYVEKTGNPWYDSNSQTARTDPVMIKIVEQLGSKADGFCSKISIENIPDAYQFEITEYDGCESIQIYPPENWREMTHEQLKNAVETMIKFNHW